MDFLNRAFEVKLWIIISALLSATVMTSAMTATMTALVMSQQKQVAQAPHYICPTCPPCKLPSESPAKRIHKARTKDWVPSNDGKVY